MAKSQRRSNKEVRKPKANPPKKSNVSNPSTKGTVLSQAQYGIVGAMTADEKAKRRQRRPRIKGLQAPPKDPADQSASPPHAPATD